MEISEKPLKWLRDLKPQQTPKTGYNTAHLLRTSVSGFAR